MYVFYTILAAAAFFLPLTTSSVACKHLSANVNFGNYNGTSLFSANIGFLYDTVNGSKNVLSVDTIGYSVNPAYPYIIRNNFCSYINDQQYNCVDSESLPFVTFPDSNFTLTYGLNITDGTVNYTEFFSFILADEGSFSMDNGPMFTGKLNKFVYQLPVTLQEDAIATYTYTCDLFENTTVSQISAPKCQLFSSRSTVYDATNNFALFATAKAYYNISSGNKITIDIDYDGPDSTQFAIGINNFFYCENVTVSQAECVSAFGGDETKYLFFASMSFSNATNVLFNAPEFLIGKIINSNGMTLMEDGKPYTYHNDCTYYSLATFSTKYVAVSEFCCKAFE
uniref:Uncharacterized protein n=1 Tax=Panagrolaimus sp. ES5 TaxID=591445 RepID=A0AC34FBF2_9BILA